MENKQFFTNTRVLIVDDDKATLYLLNVIITNLGIETETAHTFEQAAKFIKHSFFHTILLDIFIGKDNGLNLLELSKKVQPDTPVIMMTATPSLETATEAVRSGAYDYLHKPINKENLSILIRRTIELRLLREEKKRVEKENKKYLRGLEKLVAQQTRNLPESEAQYCKLVQFSSEPMFILNSKGKFIFLNLAMINLLIYSETELLDMCLNDLFAHSDMMVQCQIILDENGLVSNFEVELLRKDGRRVSVLLSLTTTRNMEDNIEKFQGTIHDITPNKRASDKLRNTGNFLLSPADSLSHPFLLTRAADYTVKLANDAAKIYNIAGYHTCYSLLYGLTEPCSKTERPCIINEIKTTKKPAVITFYIKDKAGKVRYKEAHGFPILDETGDVGDVIYYVLDVTEQEKARLQLQLLSTAVEQAADSIVITDRNGVIQYVNEAFEVLSGYAKDEAIGKLPSILNSGRHDSAFYKELWDIIIKGGIWRGHLTNKKKDGTFYEETSSIYPVKDENGQILNFVAIKQDVTETMRLQSIVEAANLMDNIGFIFSAIQHEIGNPLNSVKMALTVLDRNLQDYSPKIIDEFVKRALGEVDRIGYLLKAFKSFNFHESVKNETLRIDDLINRFVRLVGNDFQKKGVSIKTDIPPEAIWVYANYRVLHQVFLNLLTNASDALQEQENPWVLFSVKRSGGLVHINVSDNGMGMSAEELQKILQPFYTTKSHGTGLGLVIVKKMLLKMNSSIKIESCKGKGTTISMSIPEAQNVEQE